MGASSSFFLRKWYLDCITENGDSFIGYFAELEWNALRLHYSSVISAIGTTAPETRMSLKKGGAPKIASEKILWQAPALGIDGTWNSRCGPVEQILFDGEEGRVTWSCLQPHSDAEVRFEKQHLRGAGYAEILEITIKPWKLPISELRWGRFHSANDSVVWIDWLGDYPQTRVFLNGVQTLDATVNDCQIRMNGVDILDLHSRKELRSGALVSTVLSAIPGMELIVPPRLLYAHERKWLTHGQLHMKDVGQASGWAIHELVKFAR